MMRKSSRDDEGILCDAASRLQCARSSRWACCALLLSSCQLRFGDATTSSGTPVPAVAQDFPAVDPGYIYDQLDHMATSYLHRESGYDTNLPA